MSDSLAAEQMVKVSRVFDASREEVFRAWIDPAEVSAWYGPAGMEVPLETVKIEPRVGGRWELTMVSPDGERRMPLGYEILELVEPELLVLRSDPMPGMEKQSVVRVELEADGEQTRLTLTDGPLPENWRAPAEGGWKGALEKLAARLA